MGLEWNSFDAQLNYRVQRGKGLKSNGEHNKECKVDALLKKNQKGKGKM